MNDDLLETMTRAGRVLTSPALRGTLIFFSGLILTIRESLGHGTDRGQLYILWGGMMGLGALQGAAQKKKPTDDAKDDKDGDE